MTRYSVTGPSVLYDRPVTFSHWCNMETFEGIFVNPVTGMMVTRLRDGGYHVAVPGRQILELTPEQVEHVTYVTRPTVAPVSGTSAGNPRR